MKPPSRYFLLLLSVIILLWDEILTKQTVFFATRPFFTSQHRDKVLILAVQCSMYNDNASEDEVTQFVPTLPKKVGAPVEIVHINFQGFVYFNCCKESCMLT